MTAWWNPSWLGLHYMNILYYVSNKVFFFSINNVKPKLYSSKDGHIINRFIEAILSDIIMNLRHTFNMIIAPKASLRSLFYLSWCYLFDTKEVVSLRRVQWKNIWIQRDVPNTYRMIYSDGKLYKWNLLNGRKPYESSFRQ
jgi:hypothetical protein